MLKEALQKLAAPREFAFEGSCLGKRGLAVGCVLPLAQDVPCPCFEQEPGSVPWSPQLGAASQAAPLPGPSLAEAGRNPFQLPYPGISQQQRSQDVTLKAY